jgi:shikimate kinase
MSQPRRFDNLALIGFMGTGKSTVGHFVASMLDFDFVDTDEMIERRAGRRIAEIFSVEGEGQFRSYEKEIVEQLNSLKQTVISTGGGVGGNPDHLEALKSHALVVCLWASPETILKRVGQSNRPLLQGGDRLEKIRGLLQAREPSYRKADVLLNSEWRSPREVALHIVHQFRSVRGQSQS